MLLAVSFVSFSQDIMWTKTYGNEQHNYLRVLGLDSTGNPFCSVGYYDSTIILSGDSIVNILPKNANAAVNKNGELFYSKGDTLYDGLNKINLGFEPDKIKTINNTVLVSGSFDEKHSLKIVSNGQVVDTIESEFPIIDFDLNDSSIVFIGNAFGQMVLGEHTLSGELKYKHVFNETQGAAIKIDKDGNIYMCGEFNRFVFDTIDVPGPTPYRHYNNFLLKLDQQKRVKVFEPIIAYLYDVDVLDNDIFLAATLVKPNTAFGDTSINLIDGLDGAVVKYNNGFKWVVSCGREGNDMAHGITYDGNYVYLSGQFNNGENLTDGFITKIRKCESDPPAIEYDTVYAGEPLQIAANCDYPTWYNSDGVVFSEASMEWFYQPDTVYVTNVKDGCESEKTQVIIEFLEAPAGINEGINPLSIYPNPSTGSIIIISPKPQNIKIFDSVGKVREVRLTRGENTISLQPGIYFIAGRKILAK